MDFSTRLREALDEINARKQGNQGNQENQVIAINITATDVTATLETISPASGKWLDPRPDLDADVIEWQILMSMVDNMELYHMLDSMREIGTKLERSKTKFRLAPHIDPTGSTGFESMEQYEQMRDHLLKFKTEINDLMVKLHYRCNPREVSK